MSEQWWLRAIEDEIWAAMWSERVLFSEVPSGE